MIYALWCNSLLGGSRGYEKFTEIHFEASYREKEECPEVRYEVTCMFQECIPGEGDVESVGESRATTWLSYLATAL